jgi:hypothetical protein
MMEAVGSMSLTAGFHSILMQGCFLLMTWWWCCLLQNEKNNATPESFPWLGWRIFIDMPSPSLNIFKYFLIFKYGGNL